MLIASLILTLGLFCAVSYGVAPRHVADPTFNMTREERLARIAAQYPPPNAQQAAAANIRFRTREQPAEVPRPAKQLGLPVQRDEKRSARK